MRWAALVLLLAGCGEAAKGTACVPGTQAACACLGGGDGVQVCADDGARFEACGCGSAAADVVAPADVEDVAAPGELPPAPEDAPAPSIDTTPTASCDPCGYGDVKGIICAPSEQVFVPKATVTIDVVDCDGKPLHLETLSGLDGTYTFEKVPCGLHKVHVKAGSFENSYNIQVETGKTTDITGVGKKQCFKAGAVPIAVFWGQWDHQGGLLEKLGFQFTYYNFEWDYFNDTKPDDIEAVQVLRDPAALAKYTLLFFNCGSAALTYVNMFPEIKANLRDFVLAGGSMYASDLAWAYVEGAFPDAIDFYGKTDLPQGPTNDGPQEAKGQQTVPATIIDTDLSGYVGVSTFAAFYGPGPLIAIAAPGPDAVERVRGPVQIEDSSFAGSHPEVGPLVVTVSPPYPGAGRIVYTTFHNDEQADALMLKILYYLVFQL